MFKRVWLPPACIPRALSCSSSSSVTTATVSRTKSKSFTLACLVLFNTRLNQVDRSCLLGAVQHSTVSQLQPKHFIHLQSLHPPLPTETLLSIRAAQCPLDFTSPFLYPLYPPLDCESEAEFEFAFGLLVKLYWEELSSFQTLLFCGHTPQCPGITSGCSQGSLLVSLGGDCTECQRSNPVSFMQAKALPAAPLNEGISPFPNLTQPCLTLLQPSPLHR